MKTVLGIDPGTTESAFVVWDGETLHSSGFVPNEEIITGFKVGDIFGLLPDEMHVEMVACYGMPVGKEVFETCLWIGRFIERSPYPSFKVYRQEVKLHLCQSARAKDANVRQALIDKHGAPGTKKNPGKIYGISGHLWAALAVADYALTNPTK